MQFLTNTVVKILATAHDFSQDNSRQAHPASPAHLAKPHLLSVSTITASLITGQPANWHPARNGTHPVSIQAGSALFFIDVGSFPGEDSALESGVKMCLCPTALWLLIDSCALIKHSNSTLPGGMHLSREIRRREMRTTWVFKIKRQRCSYWDMQMWSKRFMSLSLCGSAVPLGEVYPSRLVASWYSDTLCSCPRFLFLLHTMI